MEVFVERAHACAWSKLMLSSWSSYECVRGTGVVHFEPRAIVVVLTPVVMALFVVVAVMAVRVVVVAALVVVVMVPMAIAINAAEILHIFAFR